MGAAAILGAASWALPDRAPRAMVAITPPPVFDGNLSVMTYNIRGLPWPIGRGRAADLASIAERLRALREQGHAPHIVVLQESFTADARAIGPAAGYRYIASGLAADDIARGRMDAADRSFASNASFWKGETEGKFVGSGLQVLSDYPIAQVRRFAFPAFACAGFDCLANKGALFVTIDVPGAPSPIDVVTTHLNSRHASQVADERSNHAYQLQVGALSRFIRANHAADRPLIVAGDFNVGVASLRRSALLSARRAWGSPRPVLDALNEYRAEGGRLGADALYSWQRARDWQFYSDGANASLRLTGIDAPFGGVKDGQGLSDHVGYTATFRLERAVTRPG